MACKQLMTKIGCLVKYEVFGNKQYIPWRDVALRCLQIDLMDASNQ